MTWLDDRRRLVLSCAGLATAALVWAVAAGVASDAAKNLIVNGNAEQGEGVGDVNGIAADIPGWTRVGNFTVVKYDAPGGFPAAKLGAAIAGGANFFAGGPRNVHSSIRQDVDVTSLKRLIGSGKAKATLSGNLGGYATQTDYLAASATFLGASGARLGTIKIRSASPTARANETALPKKTMIGAVPRKTRTVRVTLAASRGAGDYNDGYADNLSLTIGR